MSVTMERKLNQIEKIKNTDFYNHALEILNNYRKNDEKAQLYYEVAAIWQRNKRAMMGLINDGVCEHNIDRYFVEMLDDVKDLLEGMKRNWEVTK